MDQEKLYQAFRETYQRKQQAMVQQAWPVIKDVFEKQGKVYENIVVPISDGSKIFQILTNLEKAYETNGHEVLGGFEKTAQIIRWAQQHSLTPVISSAFQTSLATRMYLFFAALNGITHIPLGLDTGKWFREDLLSTPIISEKGKILIPSLTDRPKLRQSFLKISEVKC